MTPTLGLVAGEMAMRVYPYDSEHRDRIKAALLEFGGKVLDEAKKAVQKHEDELQEVLKVDDANKWPVNELDRLCAPSCLLASIESLRAQLKTGGA